MQAEDYDRVRDKIRKLMAMAERGNSPNEQAIARRQAEALMRKHGICRAEVLGTATPFGEQPAWEDTFTFRADADSRSKPVAETHGLRFATLAQWAVRLSWLLILFVPVSAQVVSEPAPAIPNVLQMLIDAWNGSGLLAAAVVLLVGAVKLALVALWSAFWHVSLVMHALFWELTDWSRLAMGPGLLHIPVACALGALVAWLTGALFGYDHRREHRILFFAGVVTFGILAAVALVLLALDQEEDAGGE